MSQKEKGRNELHKTALTMFSVLTSDTGDGVSVSSKVDGETDQSAIAHRQIIKTVVSAAGDTDI